MAANDKRNNLTADIIDVVQFKIGGVDKTSALSATTGTNTGDNSPNTNANAYADAKVADNLTSSATVAPSKDAVNTGLGLRELATNKDASGGYVGLTLFGINFKNALNTFTSLIKNSNTAIRNYTFQDRDGTIADDTDLTNTLNSAKAYADGLVVGLWDDRGNHDVSGNTYPSSGGSGTAGAILKGDIWTASVAGVLNSKNVEIGDTIRALVDTPAQTNANWAVAETNIGYVPENSANKNASNGYAGLSSLKIVMRNVADTFSSFFTNTNTASRTYTLQNRDGIIADDTDLALKVAKAGAETITGLKTFDATTGLALPATSGTTPSTGTNLRLEASDNTILDIGADSAKNWIQSTDKTDLSQKYALLLNPNGGNVGVGQTAPIYHLQASTVEDIAGLKTYGAQSEGLGVYYSRNTSDDYRANIDFIANRTSSGSAGGAGFRFFYQPRSAGFPTQGMVLNSSGDLGIGDSAPAHYAGFTNLSIKGTTNSSGGVIDLKTLDSSAVAQISLTSTALDIQAVTAIPIRLHTNGNIRAVITDTGNVEVVKNTKTASLQINGNEVSTGYGKAIESYVASNVGYINCFDRDSAVAEFDLVIDALSHTFKTGTTGAGTTRMTISSTGVVTFSKAVRGSETALTSTSNSIAVDFALTNDFTHTFTENTTLANPSNVVVGQSGSFRFTQHASSPKTLAYGSSYKFIGGTPSVSAVNSASDTLNYIVRSSTFIECSLAKGWA